MSRRLVLDGSAVTDAPALHDALARLLRFPDVYGRNWDALRDDMVRRLDAMERSGR